MHVARGTGSIVSDILSLNPGSTSSLISSSENGDNDRYEDELK